jgi:hypothetical protein
VDECKPLVRGREGALHQDGGVAGAQRVGLLRGKAVQVAAMKSKLKVPATKLLRLKHDELLSILLQFCFQFNLRRYIVVPDAPTAPDFHMWELIDQQELAAKAGPSTTSALFE